MSNYNTTLQSNNIDLQAILNTINKLPDASGDPVLQDKTVTPTTSKQTVSADSGYDGLNTVTVNAMTTATQATPSITINDSGLITATATQTAGYVAAGTKSATHQLSTQAASTIMPKNFAQYAVSAGKYTTGDIIVAGDSDLLAGNIKKGVDIFGVTGTYEGSGGSTDVEDSLITVTVTTYTNDRVGSIGSYAFYSCSSLTSVNFPVATTIGSNAFSHCSNLTSVSFPKVATIGSNAFCNCSKLTSVSFPVTTSIGVSAFRNCSSLTSVSFPVATTIGSNAFYNCSKLTSVSFPVATTIGIFAFSGCASLTSVSFPVATTIGSNAFYNCSKLTSVSFPKVATIGSYAFHNCSKLTSARFPAATSIGSYVFSGCSSLATIYLTNSSVCKLDASNAFSNTGIWSNKGSIFVPSSLVASYKTATNWAFFSNRIYSA